MRLILPFLLQQLSPSSDVYSPPSFASLQSVSLCKAIVFKKGIEEIRTAARALIARKGGNRTCLDEVMGVEERKSIILMCGGEFPIEDYLSWTPMGMVLVMKSGPDVVGMLLEEGASPDTLVGPEAMSPLCMASGDCTPAIVQHLLAAGGAVNVACGNLQRTPLHIACMKNHLPITRQLLAAGADVESRCRDDWTPLHMAVFGGHLSIMKALLEAGASVHVRGSAESGNASLLHIASREGHPHLFEALLSAGAELNRLTHAGSAPLHVAVQFGQATMVHKLLAAGAEVDSGAQFTPLFAAAYYSREWAMQELFRAGASLPKALKAARQRGHPECAVRLLAANKRYSDSQRVVDVMRVCDGVCWEKEGRSQQKGGPLQRGLRPEALELIAAAAIADEVP